MNPFHLKHALESVTILIDTREQDTTRFRKRLKEIGLPSERRKLDFGDYSIKTILPDETEFSLAEKVCIERKMNIDELCACFCRGRKRFEREFLRAKDAGAKLYLLIENGSWESVLNGEYRTQMEPKALVASLTAWLARYNCQLLFCEPSTTGRLIRELLYREIKEALEAHDH